MVRFIANFLLAQFRLVGRRISQTRCAEPGFLDFYSALTFKEEMARAGIFQAQTPRDPVHPARKP